MKDMVAVMCIDFLHRLEEKEGEYSAYGNIFDDGNGPIRNLGFIFGFVLDFLMTQDISSYEEAHQIVRMTHMNYMKLRWKCGGIMKKDDYKKLEPYDDSDNEDVLELLEGIDDPDYSRKEVRWLSKCYCLVMFW